MPLQGEIHLRRFVPRALPLATMAEGFALVTHSARLKRGMRAWVLSTFIITAASRTLGAESWNNPPHEKIAGVEHHTFKSASMNVEVGFNIYLPPQYATEKAKRFPVIYYLHGIKGNESSYLDYAHLLDQATKSGGVAPTILIFANGGETSFFSDSPDHSVMGETIIVRELVPYIDQHYRTIPAAHARSLHGFSMGGFGALKFAFKYPEMFQSVVSYAAILPDAKTFAAKERKVFQKAFGDEAGFAKNDPFQLLQENASKLRGQKVQLV